MRITPLNRERVYAGVFLTSVACGSRNIGHHTSCSDSIPLFLLSTGIYEVYQFVKEVQMISEKAFALAGEIGGLSDEHHS